MSRIYIVTNKAGTAVVRYVRAHTLAGAMRAVAEEHFSAGPASTEQVFQAMKADAFDVLDAVAPERVDIADDPGPVPRGAK